jgi:protein phosphatase
MRHVTEICARDPAVLLATIWREVSLNDETAIGNTISWWADLTQGGGEGLVMKPGKFVALGSKGLIQPALKVRGVEYLRLIYGPEYTILGKLERLRERGLSAQSEALR